MRVRKEKLELEGGSKLIVDCDVERKYAVVPAHDRCVLLPPSCQYEKRRWRRKVISEPGIRRWRTAGGEDATTNWGASNERR